MDNTAADTPVVSDSDLAYIINKNIGDTESGIQAEIFMRHKTLIRRHDLLPRLYQLERKGYVSLHPNPRAPKFGKIALLTPKGERKLLD